MLTLQNRKSVLDKLSAGNLAEGRGMRSEPLVSIIINNYNYGRFLREAIESGLNQLYANVEVIVVDDGSTDNSREIISEYGHRLIPILKNNGGQASAFNAGFAASNGEWIFLLDSDDLFLPQKIGNILDLAERNPTAGVIAHNLSYCDRFGASIEFLPPLIGERKLIDGKKPSLFGRRAARLPATSGMCFRSSVLRDILPMPEEIRVTADDYLKTVARSLTSVLETPERLAKQRIHGANLYTGKGDIQAGEAGKLLCARVEAQIGFEIRKRHPHLKRLSWRHYGRALCRLASVKSAAASTMKAEIKSRYSVMDQSLACYVNVAGSFTKTFVKDLVRRSSNL